MYSVPVPTFPNQFRGSPAMNSGPLSEPMCFGTPRTNLTSANTSITWILPNRRATRNAKHSRVYSSISTRMGRPVGRHLLCEVVAPHVIGSLRLCMGTNHLHRIVWSPGW
jgi:hypothetical protein